MAKPYRTYAIVSHRNGDSAEEERRISTRLRKRHPWMRRVAPEAADLLLVFGGDGTLLDAIRRRPARNPHLLAFNCGHVGFLSTAREKARFAEALDLALAGRLMPMTIPLMRVIHRSAHGTTAWAAVNDVIVDCPMTWLTLPAETVGRDGATPIKEIRGTGLCVCSAIGSTSPMAVHLHATPMDPSIRAFYLRGTNDTRRLAGGLLLSGKDALRISLTRIEPNQGIPVAHRRPPSLFADGLHAGTLEIGDTVEVRYLPTPSTLLRLPDDGHWNRLASLG